MSKSIAKQVLAIAEKKEAERLEPIKEEFLAIMRKEFQKYVDACKPWTAISTNASTKYYIYSEIGTFKDFDLHDLETVARKVGFEIKFEDEKREVHLSIPEWVKGKKRTQAQLMLYWSNIEINRKIKSRKELAQRISKEVLEKLKKGEFVVYKDYDYSYGISVEMSYSDVSNELMYEVKSFFAKKKIIPLRNIRVECGEWKLEIAKN